MPEWLLGSPPGSGFHRRQADMRENRTRGEFSLADLTRKLKAIQSRVEGAQLRLSRKLPAMFEPSSWMPPSVGWGGRFGRGSNG
jgi:hypothetical protein